MLSSGWAKIKRLLFYCLVIFVIFAIASALKTTPAVFLNHVGHSVLTQFTQLFTGHSHVHAPSIHVHK